MSQENLGNLFKCDNCGAEQIIKIDGNRPTDWTTGKLTVDSGWYGPIMHFCPKCWPGSMASDAAKIPLLIRLFAKLGKLTISRTDDEPA